MRIRSILSITSLSALVLLSGATCKAPSLPCSDPSCGEVEEGEYELSAPVDVVRDDDGIVHLYAQTDADVYYAAGYMQATDRLYQMDLMRRQTYGRRAEVLGEGAVGDDTLIRSLDVVTWGKKNAEAARQDPEAFELVEAWTAGVNRRIDEVLAGDAPMPLGFTVLGTEPEKWIPDDIFVVGKAIVFDNGNQLEFDILASLIRKYQPDIFADLPFYSPLVDEFIVGEHVSGQSERSRRVDRPGSSPEAAPLPADAADRLRAMQERLAFIRPGASNNWAVGPGLTDTGRSLISGDPHQPLRSPSLMWMLHMNSADAGGTIDLAGWTFVGTPGVSLGHNRDIAWTATTNYPDVTDIWDVEVIDGQVMVGGESIPLESREETITVKDADPVTITVDVVPGYGVLLPTDLVPLPLVDVGHRLLFNWTGYRVTNEARSFLEFGRSENVDEFDAAVDGMELGSFNFVAASADEITYRSSPIVPDRGDPSEGDLPYALLDGADPAALWTGEFLPLDRMPHARPGPDGVLVSANNDPFGFTADGSLSNDPYYFGAYFDPGTRAGRVRMRLDELSAAGPITADDMMTLQLDTHSLLADELVPLLEDAWSHLDTDEALAAFRDRPDLEALFGVLSSWDRSFTREQAGPVAFEAFSNLFVRAAIADDMGLFFEPVASGSTIYVLKLGLLAARAPGAPLLQEGKDVVLLTALSETAAWLEERFGAVDSGYSWADYHATQFPSESIPELDGGSSPTDGGEGTINVSEGSFYSGSDIAAMHFSSGGPIFRMTATFDEDGTPRAFFTAPRGQSGEPDDPHFDDMMDDWVEGQYRLLRFQREDVDAAAAETFTLEP